MIKEKLYTRKEVAELLKVDISTLYRWEIKHPDYLPAIRIGRGVRYKESTVLRLL